MDDQSGMQGDPRYNPYYQNKGPMQGGPPQGPPGGNMGPVGGHGSPMSGPGGPMQPNPMNVPMNSQGSMGGPPQPQG